MNKTYTVHFACLNCGEWIDDTLPWGESVETCHIICKNCGCYAASGKSLKQREEENKLKEKTWLNQT